MGLTISVLDAEYESRGMIVKERNGTRESEQAQMTTSALFKVGTQATVMGTTELRNRPAGDRLNHSIMAVSHPYFYT